MKNYLQETPMLNYSNKSIQELIERKGWKHLDEFHRILEIYNFVRDDILFGYNINDNVTASQAADVMLTLKKVEASFVIFERPDQTIGISARSMGGLNVQTLMEEMGGGGHLTTAATQIKESSLDQVYQDLLETIQRNKEES